MNICLCFACEYGMIIVDSCRIDSDTLREVAGISEWTRKSMGEQMMRLIFGHYAVYAMKGRRVSRWIGNRQRIFWMGQVNEWKK